MDLGGGVGESERDGEGERERLLHSLSILLVLCQLQHACLPICCCVASCLNARLALISGFSSSSSLSAATERTQQPAFTLEEKAPVKSSGGDGGGGEAGSLSPGPAPQSLTPAESPWQSESLLAESWSTMGDVDPEDTKSLDSNDEVVLGGEENHSSNSDMVHLEREQAEMLEEAEKEEGERRAEEEEDDDEELQTSVLSVLGSERELVELREEVQDLRAPETEELLVSVEEPRTEKKPAEFMQVVPPMALPPLPIVRLDPPSATSTPVPSTTATEAEELYSTQGLHPPSILARITAEPPSQSVEQQFSQIPLSDVEEHSVKASQAEPEKPEPPQPTAPKTPKPLSSTELLCGGAALVAVVGVVAYGAVAYCRK
ncbi:proline-, glutamic acid- and leucine-rich protein 1-like [Plectropomus leopardus]|uniref:proline-, glutamic acid- and leucine-rich protein 1-like n=1 Tax=Plectropomus leopardus TaxID=160734 RepID=UPI001C4BA33B|nr:proline-, glutamic acid- and leucine-rich protein 1-like [Plectropomus leopardus]